ncbi:MAG: hypothetical protein K0M45_09105 [Candidatus Paracaedibacteraceae bacterium]|nr:hypothetical protein [Candidatus Paracaedibacteraceae bacterium]
MRKILLLGLMLAYAGESSGAEKLPNENSTGTLNNPTTTLPTYHIKHLEDQLITSDVLEDVKKELNNNKDLVVVSSHLENMRDNEIMAILKWLKNNKDNSNLYRFIWMDNPSFFTELGMPSTLPRKLLEKQNQLYYSSCLSK